jgi:hypothetical protein
MLARYYPTPKFNTIIEPFSGSAAYTCFHLLKDPELNAILCDKDDNVAEAWDFLLKCSEDDIINYPKPKIGEYAYDFLIKTCSVSNASSKCIKMKYTERIDEVFEIQKRRILKFLNIRSRIIFKHGEYSDLENIEGTWFIDPPYQVLTTSNTPFSNGDGYSKDCGTCNINFQKLANYCKERKGQVIVCEKEGANWLPFVEFKKNKTSLNKTYKEVFWLNDFMAA